MEPLPGDKCSYGAKLYKYDSRSPSMDHLPEEQIILMGPSYTPLN
jgi:hypothetical protein